MCLQRDSRLPRDDSWDIFRQTPNILLLFNLKTPILNHPMQVLPPTLEGLKF